VPVKIIRRGKVKKLTIKILELPSDDQVIASQGEQVGAKSNVLNLIVSNLNKEQKEELELTDHGVLIDKVGEGPAQSAGIKSGDILLLLNNEKVKDSKHFQELISDLPKGKSIPVLIQRRGGPIFLALKIDE
jgi:serine protease Do